MDLSAASSAALASLDGGATPAPESTPAAPATDNVQQTSTDQTATTPAPVADPTKQPTPATYKVKDNGQEVEVSLDELLSGHLRHRDYTKKTMDLASQRKQFEEQQTAATSRETAINEFLRSADQIAAYYQYLTGQPLQQQQQTSQTQVDPNAPVTYAQAQEALARQSQMMQQQLGQVQQLTQKEIAKLHELNQSRLASEAESDVTKFISGLLDTDDLKVLNAVDEIQDVLSADAMKLRPRNIEEAKAAIKQVAHSRAEKMNAHFKEMLKANTVSQQQLATKGIEPPGGTGVTPTPTNFKLGDKSLSTAAQAWLESQMKK